MAYKRRNLPIKIIGEFKYRRKEDFEDDGWMFKSLFSGKRYIIVIRKKPFYVIKNKAEGLGKAILKKFIAKVKMRSFVVFGRN